MAGIPSDDSDSEFDGYVNEDDVFSEDAGLQNFGETSCSKKRARHQYKEYSEARSQSKTSLQAFEHQHLECQHSPHPTFTLFLKCSFPFLTAIPSQVSNRAIYIYNYMYISCWVIALTSAPPSHSLATTPIPVSIFFSGVIFRKFDNYN